MEAPNSPADEAAELTAALATRGVAPRSAADLVKTHPSARVRTKLEVFDWLVKNEDKRVAKNPAGYLVASIRDDYTPPGGFAAPSKPAPVPVQGRRAGPRLRGRPPAPLRGPPRGRGRQGPRGQPPRPAGTPCSAADQRRDHRPRQAPRTPAFAAGRRCSNPSASPSSTARSPPASARPRSHPAQKTLFDDVKAGR